MRVSLPFQVSDGRCRRTTFIVIEDAGLVGQNLMSDVEIMPTSLEGSSAPYWKMLVFMYCVYDCFEIQ